VGTLPNSELSTRRLGYRPALDGVRGVSILVVMAAHAKLISLSFGFVGVDIFFVLSGFLITSLLVEEWLKYGFVSLKAFYLRRALRLLPALTTLVLVLIGLHLIIPSWRRNVWDIALNGLGALCYVSNWLRILNLWRGTLLDHTWSLSIEEQFYLIWPWCLLLLLKRVGSFTAIIRWLVFALVVVIFWRMLTFFSGANEFRTSRGTDTRADSLLMGCIAGVLFATGLMTKASWFKWLIKGLAFLAIPALARFGSREGNPNIYVAVVYPLTSLFAVILILELLLAETGKLNWFFSQPWLVYVGRLSYTLYLWHFPIFVMMEPYGLAAQLSVTMAVTVLSFYLVERPSLNFKKRFSRVG
jgi:peptidoglycan/LPS O-acetylase OafA/YrhL